jgi:hypothetical protein
MTPTVVTPAGRGPGTKKPAPRGSGAKAPGRGAGATTPARTGSGAKSSAGRTTGHPGTIRKRTSPQAPRRVSGPLKGLVRGRVQARPPKAPAPTRSVSRPLPLGRRTVSFVRSLPNHALLDRIIRGRAWIPLLGVMLAGIVAMQVEVLKLSASMGRSIERSTSLQSRNEILRASVAGLADDQRIERLAVGMGMLMPAPDAVNFLAVGKAPNVGGAVAGIHQPNAAGFIALLPVTTASSGASSTTLTPTSSASPVVTTRPPASPAVSSPASVATPSSTAPVVGSASGPASTGAPSAPPTPTTASPSAASSAPAGQPSSGPVGASGGASPVGG